MFFFLNENFNAQGLEPLYLVCSIIQSTNLYQIYLNHGPGAKMVQAQGITYRLITRETLFYLLYFLPIYLQEV